jgi:hypothetical protein
MKRAQHAWSAAGYAREPQWRRWTKPLSSRPAASDPLSVLTALPIIYLW